MGREVRMVPADWRHPTTMEPDRRRDKAARRMLKDGEVYIPLLDRSYDEAAREWDAGLALWLIGARESWSAGAPPEPHGGRCDVWGWVEWSGKRPCPSEYMPDWPAEQRTHFQMYEDTSEGTPISPPMPTAESLARYLADNNASAFGGDTATYEGWLGMIRAGWAPSIVIADGRMMSGPEFVATHPKEPTRAE